ncbi:hypothetical protein [Tumebacillus flagellatus]|uniref:globin domain-containing protein n=1 Tax=Tumebacillus flagellatus TaxID=1157490 RepID=UPI00056FEC56|nr:hypothetical protein [Tumebacillus flagellatus]
MIPEPTVNLTSELQAFLQADGFRTLVDLFYDRVSQHPDLIPIFPEDFTEVREKQYCFLTQFFGGEPLYSQTYGPPSMMRIHSEHPITPRRAKAWLWCMKDTLEHLDIHEALRKFFYDRLAMVAQNFINTSE